MWWSLSLRYEEKLFQLFYFPLFFAILPYMKNTYELVLIFRSSIEEKNKERVLELIKKTISPGKITETKDWGKRMLAYSIKKEKEGNYLLLTLESDGKEAVKLLEALKSTETVLRYLLVRKE